MINRPEARNYASQNTSLRKMPVKWVILHFGRYFTVNNTSQLIHLISVTNEESLVVRGNLHRNNNRLTWIYHCITWFGPQSLNVIKHSISVLSVFNECILSPTLKTIIYVQPAWWWFRSKCTYMLWSGSSKADDSIEPEYWVWKQLLIRRAKKANILFWV